MHQRKSSNTGFAEHNATYSWNTLPFSTFQFALDMIALPYFGLNVGCLQGQKLFHLNSSLIWRRHLGHSLYKRTFLNACSTRKDWGHKKMMTMFCPKATVESDCDCEVKDYWTLESSNVIKSMKKLIQIQVHSFKSVRLKWSHIL